MNVAVGQPWTQEQFFAWADTQDGRYEFDGVQPVAMTGGGVNHNRVMWGVHRALDRRLPRGPGACDAIGPDAGFETVDKAVRYPDALITSTRVDGDSRLVPGVVVLFEVLSPMSGRGDRIIKVREYAAVPSVRRYVIVESSSVGLTVMERSSPDQSWQTTVLTNGDTLRMAEFDVEIPVGEIYEGIAFVQAPESP